MSQLLQVVGYTVMLVCASYLCCLALALLKIVRNQSAQTTSRRESALRHVLGLLAASVCCAFFYDNMFVRFSCVEIGTNQITLRYFWPKPSHAIALDELTQVEIERSRKQHRQLVIISRQREDRSIVCERNVDLEPALNAIRDLAKRGAAGK